MPITLPEWAHAIPNPAHAPSPEAVVRLYTPLAHLYPLLQAANTHSITTTMRIGACIDPRIGAPDRIWFHRFQGSIPSAHTILADPWTRPNTKALEQEILDAATPVANILDTMFARHLTGKENLKGLGNVCGVSLAIAWPGRGFDIPPGPDCPLHMAALLGVLERVFDATPRPSGRIPSRAAPSYACPDWKTALEPRIRALGRHMNHYFATEVWV